MLKLKKIHKVIAGVTIIDHLTAAFPRGVVSALVGPNGAGKTSLFNLITGEMHVDSGSIAYCRKELTKLPAHRIARQGVGRLFQDVRVFENLSVLENIMAACFSPAEDQPWFPFLHPIRLRQTNRLIRNKAEAILDRFGLRDKKDCPAGELSFGQQKILAIGRLLASDCSLLLFDEPTAGLHQDLIPEILAIIKQIIDQDKEKTIIVVEHNMSVVREVAQWVFFMNEGKLAFTGRTDHVLGCREVRELYLGLRGDEK